MDNCMLSPDGRYCTSANRCYKCGFDRSVHKAREDLRKEKGLTLCQDGLRRLVLPRKKLEEN